MNGYPSRQPGAFPLGYQPFPPSPASFYPRTPASTPRHHRSGSTSSLGHHRSGSSSTHTSSPIATLPRPSQADAPPARRPAPLQLDARRDALSSTAILKPARAPKQPRSARRESFPREHAEPPMPTAAVPVRPAGRARAASHAGFAAAPAISGAPAVLRAADEAIHALQISPTHHDAAILLLCSTLRTSLHAVLSTLSRLPASIFAISDPLHARWAHTHGALLAALERNAARCLSAARAAAARPSERDTLRGVLGSLEARLRALAREAEYSAADWALLGKRAPLPSSAVQGGSASRARARAGSVGGYAPSVVAAVPSSTRRRQLSFSHA